MNEMSFQNLAIIILVTDVCELKFGLLKTFFVFIIIQDIKYVWKFNMEEYIFSWLVIKNQSGPGILSYGCGF